MKKKNLDVLHDSTLNKSVGFTRDERQHLGLRGLLPYAIASLDIEVSRIKHKTKSIRHRDIYYCPLCKIGMKTFTTE